MAKTPSRHVANLTDAETQESTEVDTTETSPVDDAPNHPGSEWEEVDETQPSKGGSYLRQDGRLFRKKDI